MSRTTVTAVAGILADNWNGTTGLQPFIDAASSMVDDIVTYDDEGVMTTSKLELVERWLAAHFYHCADPLLQSENNNKAGGQYQGQSAMALDGSRYGQMAQKLDTSGYLEANDAAGIVGGFWLGKAPSDQTDYVDRD
jgi:hypothetical protein